MLFEGVHLYLMVVKVFNVVVRMRLFYTFAWGKYYIVHEIAFLFPHYIPLINKYEFCQTQNVNLM